MLNGSKGRKDWGTPAWLFDRLHEEFAFTVDAAAEAHNAKLPRFWDRSIDGLSQNWGSERVWCNPPYGREIVPWIRKAHESRGLSVLLVPARTDTAWWAQQDLNL